MVVSARDRAVDFYDELIARMEGARADEKMEAIYLARDRGEVPQGYYHRADVYRTMSAELWTCLPNSSTDRKTDGSSSTQKPGHTS